MYRETLFSVQLPASVVVELTRVEEKFSESERAKYLDIVAPGGKPEWVGPPAVIILRRGHSPDLRDGTHRTVALHAYGHGAYEIPVTLKLETLIDRP